MKNSKQESVTPHLSSSAALKETQPTSSPLSFQAVTHPTSVSLSQPEREALKAAAAGLHMSTSALIRQAIQQKLAQSQDALGSSLQNFSARQTGCTGM